VQKPAQFDIDITNRSRSKLTFVLSYWAMDGSGIRLHEQSKVLKVGASKTEKMASRLDLREGTRIFGVEANLHGGNEVWSSTKLRLTVRQVARISIGSCMLNNCTEQLRKTTTLDDIAKTIDREPYFFLLHHHRF
jgi:hypothetical protein